MVRESFGSCFFARVQLYCFCLTGSPRESTFPLKPAIRLSAVCKSSIPLDFRSRVLFWFAFGAALLFLLDERIKGEYIPPEARKDLVGRRQLEPSAYLCPFAGFSSSGFSALDFFGGNHYGGVVGCRNVRTTMLFGSGIPFFLFVRSPQKFIFENCFHF